MLGLNGILLPLTPRDLSNHRDYLVKVHLCALPTLNIRQIGYGWGWPLPYWILAARMTSGFVFFPLHGAV